MKKHLALLLACMLAFGGAPLMLTGCSKDEVSEATEAVDEVVEEIDDEPEILEKEAEEVAQNAKTTTEPAALADGEYAIGVDTDSSMFHAESCTLEVKDGAYTAHLSLPGEGFSRLYYGTAEEAAQAADEDIYDYYLNDEGLYTFDLPVSALDEGLTIAAFGHRRDTWYDHTITFHAPAEA